MEISRRRVRLQRQLHELARVGARVVAVMVISAVVVLATAAVRLSRSAIVLPVLPPHPLVHYLDHPGFLNGAVRAVYRHSIVPGGVYSAEEVQAAMLRDPVVAAHYAKLDSSRIVGTVLERPRAVYVSYRVGPRTAWTSRKIMLPAGEPLLTDGTRAIRARCGNLVSDTGGEQGVAGASGERVEPAELDQRVAPPLVVARGPEPDAAPVAALAPGDALPGAGGTPVLLGGGNPAAGPGPFFQPVLGVLPFVLAGDEPKNDTPPGNLDGPTTTTTTGVVPPTTTTTTSPSTITTFSPTTFVPTTGSVPEPTRLALLVLAWAAYRYTRRPS